jgi:hypothetical protein
VTMVNGFESRLPSVRRHHPEKSAGPIQSNDTKLASCGLQSESDSASSRSFVLLPGCRPRQERSSSFRILEDGCPPERRSAQTFCSEKRPHFGLCHLLEVGHLRDAASAWQYEILWTPQRIMTGKSTGWWCSTSR